MASSTVVKGAQLAVNSELSKKRDERSALDREIDALETAATALGNIGSSPKPTRNRRLRSSKPGARRGRKPGSGKRAQQALDIISRKPGVTIPELAKEMKIQPNYLYRVLPGLEREGKVKREKVGGKGWIKA